MARSFVAGSGPGSCVLRPEEASPSCCSCRTRSDGSYFRLLALFPLSPRPPGWAPCDVPLHSLRSATRGSSLGPALGPAHQLRPGCPSHTFGMREQKNNSVTEVSTSSSQVSFQLSSRVWSEHWRDLRPSAAPEAAESSPLLPSFSCCFLQVNKMGVTYDYI